MAAGRRFGPATRDCRRNPLPHKDLGIPGGRGKVQEFRTPGKNLDEFPLAGMPKIGAPPRTVPSRWRPMSASGRRRPRANSGEPNQPPGKRTVDLVERWPHRPRWACPSGARD